MGVVQPTVASWDLASIRQQGREAATPCGEGYVPARCYETTPYGRSWENPAAKAWGEGYDEEARRFNEAIGRRS